MFNAEDEWKAMQRFVVRKDETVTRATERDNDADGRTLRFKCLT